MNRASALDQGRNVTRPSERVTIGPWSPASLTTPILAGLAHPDDERSQRD
jgi:hypothetical protein